jgi:transcriptional regulator with XRE-family HTH domain
MKLTPNLTDKAVFTELGARLERRRIDANLTQAELAERAGISKRTVERLENGAGSAAVGLIRVLRALQLFDGLETLVPDLPQSPMALLKAKGRERKRVGHSRVVPSEVRDEPAKPWKWGE